MGGGPTNRMSELWFRTFLDSVDPAQTVTEVAFLQRQLPLGSHPRILDLCCGRGRHAIPLAESGYEITGIDRDDSVIGSARRAAPAGASFLQMDARNVQQLGRRWDAAIIMWASFGYFEREENLALLSDLRRCLSPDGRLILDVYNRDFFEGRLGERRVHRGRQEVIEHKSLVDDRLLVELRYVGHEVADRFSWQIFRPQELLDTLTAAGFAPEILCAEFNERVQPTPEHARMQVVASLQSVRGTAAPARRIGM